MATKLPYVLPFDDGAEVAAILLKAQGLPESEQIATKTELQQATAYLATLGNATMAPQSAAVKRETDNLQAQINNIVRAPESGGDVGAEVFQARVGVDGTNYPTLEDRLDTENTDVSRLIQQLGNVAVGSCPLPWEHDVYIDTSGATTDYTRIESTLGYQCCVSDCVPGDEFSLSGTGGGSPRLWAFVDNSGNILSRAGVSASMTGTIITAPSDATKLVVNSSEADSYLIKGKPMQGVNGNKFLEPLIYISPTTNVSGITDFNLFPANSIAIISATLTAVTLQHSPITDGIYGIAVVATYGPMRNNQNQGIYTQTLITGTGDYYARTGYKVDSVLNWNAWAHTDPEPTPDPTKVTILGYVSPASNPISFSDFNQAPGNSLIILSSSSTPIDLDNSPIANGLYYISILTTYGPVTGPGDQVYYTQTLECSDGRRYSRTGWMYPWQDAVNYNAWREFIPTTSNSGRIIRVAKSGGDYTTVKSAFEAAQPGDTVIIEAGEYDLIQEFGAAYFQNQLDYYSGLFINGFNVYMSPKTFIKFEYSGSNTTVNSQFSPFNVAAKDCEIVGGNIIATNCRYCIHDDPGPLSGQTDKGYKHHIKNIYMKKTDNNANWSSQRCLGGGLGQNGEVVVENCVTACDAADSSTSGIAYHNNETPGSQGYVVIKDNYCGNSGTIRVAWKGNSGTMTKMVVCGNSVGSPIVETASTGTTTPSTIEVKKFNNELRT